MAIEDAEDERIDSTVEAILKDVRLRGDEAVLEYTNKFDHVDASSVASLEISRQDLDRALAGLPVSARTGPAGTGAAYPAQTAAEPWEVAAFTGDPAAIARAAAKVPGAEDDDVVVLLMEASYSFDEAGRETYTQRLVYRILAAGAHESWSTVEESWEPWHQARPEIRARVITPDGAEHPLYRRDWAGYTNAFSRTRWGPGHTMFTRRIGLRIDHLLAGAGWRPERCRVGPEVGSAHRPLVAEFAWLGPP